MGGEPNVRKLRKVGVELVQDGHHGGSTSRVTVHGQVQQRARFVVVEIVKGLFVDIVEVQWIALQGPVV